MKPPATPDQEQLFDRARGASISACQRYRYRLWRGWDESCENCLFVMLNPSTADAMVDDPTIRRCIGYAKSWGYGGLYVVNVYAYRATQPAELWKCEDPVGPDNRLQIAVALQRTTRTIAAWGNNAREQDAAHTYWQLTADRPVYCLGVTGKGCPKHPLYLRKDQEPVLYEIAGSS